MEERDITAVKARHQRDAQEVDRMEVTVMMGVEKIAVIKTRVNAESVEAVEARQKMMKLLV